MKKVVYLNFKNYFTRACLLLVIVAGGGWATAQTTLYNQSNITVQPGASITVIGGISNEAGGSIENDGSLSLTGNWINSASNFAFVNSQGVVILDGAAQTIGGSSVTHFPSLSVLNTTTKTLLINTQVDSILDLTDAKIDVATFNLTIHNTSVNSIIRTTGYVENGNGGLLIRRTSSTGTYEFPVGSAVGTFRYRPVAITPSNGLMNNYAVGFYNHSASLDGYNLSSASTPTCFINTKFYHKIHQPVGSTSADISISFDNIADSTFTNAVNWTTLWNDHGSVNLTSNSSPVLSTVTVPAFASLPTVNVHALSINTIPNTITASTATTFCQGDTVILRAQQVQAGYQWFRNGSPLPGANADTLVATLAGTYTLEASNGICTVGSSNSISVTIHSLPSASFTPSASSACINGSAVTLTPSVTGGTFTGTGVSGNSFDPTFLAAGNYTIQYSVTDANNCTATSTQQITVNALPDASFTTSISSTCVNGNTATLIPAQAGGTFTGTGVSGNSFNPASLSASVYTVTYSITDGNNCSSTSTEQITVNALPDASFTTSASSVCENGSSVSLIPTVTGGTFSGTGVSGNSFNPASLSASVYTVTYSITDGNSCSSTSTEQITINALPDAAFTTSASSVCESGSSISLTPSVAGGTFSGTGVVGNTFDPTGLTPAAYTVTYTITNANNCTATSTEQITINPLADAGFNASASSVCIDANSISLTPNVNGGTFSGTGVTGSTFDPSLAGVGMHTVTYTITNGNCTSSETFQIVVNALPDSAFTAASPLCENAAAIVLIPSTPGGSFSGTGVSGNSFDPSIAGSGTHTIIYNITDVNGCTGQSSQVVTVNSLPVASFNTNSTLLAITAGSTSSFATTLSWDFGDGGTATGTNVSHNYSVAGTYTITLIATNACGSDTITQQITVVDGLGIENGTDGITVQLLPNPFNEYVAVRIELLTPMNIQIEIFDMLGKKIYTQGIQEFTAGNTIVDFSDVFINHAAGNYFIRLNGEGGWNQTFTAIKSSMR